MSNMDNEMEKIFSYCVDKDVVTEEDVDTVCANWLSSRIFDMTDAIAQKNQQKAMNIYYDLLALKTAPEMILAMVARQFNMMLQTKEMTENRMDNASIAKALGLHPFVASKYADWVRHYTMEDLKKSLDMCLDSDMAVKNGKLDHVISIEMIIIKASAR